MSFTHIETVAGNGNLSTSTATFSGTASAGELLVLAIALNLDDETTDLVVPSGYTSAGALLTANRFVAIYYKVADGSETDAVVSDSTDDVLVIASRYTMTGTLGNVVSATASATNVDSITVGPVSTEVGSLICGLIRKGGTLQTSTGFSNGFNARSGASGIQNEANLQWAIDKIAGSASESVTHTLSDTTTRQSGIIVSFSEVASSNAIRKGGTATFDKPAGIGTITSVTLGGNAITLDSQDASTFTVTDSWGGATTTGSHDLEATGDTVETISVQVQVVGLPSNTFQKDGAGLANLNDIKIWVYNTAETAFTKKTGVTSNGSAVIAAQDFSEVAEDVDDVVVVSLYSPSVDVGITFEQALELI